MISLKKAHQIVFNEVCGGGGDVMKKLADWFAKLNYLYHTETAYNGKKFWSLAVLFQTHFTIIP